MSRVLLRGGCVLTMGPTNHNEADVLIDGSTIAEVGTGIRARDAETIDVTGSIVMPGHVDAHRRVRDSLFRNAGPDHSAAVTYEPDDLYAATLIGLLGALDAGITTVVDWSESLADTAMVDATVRAHLEAGTRAVLVAADRTDPAGAFRRVADIAATPLLTGAAGVDLATESSWQSARDLGLRIHAAAGTETAPGTARHLAGRGLLGPDVTLVRGSSFDRTDLEAVASSGTRMVLTPSADMAAGVALAPIQELIDRGIDPGLGSDNERMSPGDVFAQMRAVISLQHATMFDRKLAGKGALPKLLTTREVIRFATVDGAAAIGLGGTTGVIEAGKQADVIVLRADRPNVHPINDPIGAVVWGMDTSNVEWVFVAGEARKRHGRLVADVARARDLATAARERVGPSSAVVGGGR
jgi:cytosine/adenosine deaminase-related metal-dependent hydrolase